MSLLMRTTDELCQIAGYGGGFRIDGSMRSTDDLCRIAGYSKGKGNTLAFTGMASRPTADLCRIGGYAPGNVIFED